MYAPTPNNLACQLLLAKLAPMVGVSIQAVEQMLQEFPVEQSTYTVSYTIKSVAFECRRCGQSLVLSRRSLGCEASGIFCNGCHDHYWMSWNGGELHNGTPESDTRELP
jgi:hypothetical protein